MLCLVVFTAAVIPVAGRELFNNWNKDVVANGPRRVTQFSLSAPTPVREIMTYHWNDGRGQAAGTIALYAADGRIFGPWRTIGTSGTGGAQNVNWIASPNITLPAGTYTVVDSDIATWSCNAGSGGAGFTIVSGGEDAPVPARTPVTTPAGGDRAFLVSLRGDRDLVGEREGLAPNGAPDTQIRVQFAGRGRTVKEIEIKNTSGPLSAWDTVPNNVIWQLGVVQGGRIMNESNGRLIPFAADANEVLDLYVNDIGGFAGDTPYAATITFQDGSKQTLAVSRSGGAAATIRSSGPTTSPSTPASPRAPAGGERAYLVSLRGDRDIVGGGEGMAANSAPDAQIRVQFAGRGRTVQEIEIRNTAGPLSAWDTVPNNGLWQMGVVRGGRVMNEANGRLIPFAADNNEVLDLYVHDIGGFAANTPYAVTLTFQDGSKQTFALGR
jgi:uncharacterized membrane protein